MRENLSLLLLRISFGATMLFAHGLPKMTKFEKLSEVFPDPLGTGSMMSLVMAIFSEVFCAAALVLGLGTRLVAIPLSITMVVAVFGVHAADPFGKKELGLLYLFVFVALAISGGGKYSIDDMFRKK